MLYVPRARSFGAGVFLCLAVSAFLGDARGELAPRYRGLLLGEGGQRIAIAPQYRELLRHQRENVMRDLADYVWMLMHLAKSLRAQQHPGESIQTVVALHENIRLIFEAATFDNQYDRARERFFSLNHARWYSAFTAVSALGLVVSAHAPETARLAGMVESASWFGIVSSAVSATVSFAVWWRYARTNERWFAENRDFFWAQMRRRAGISPSDVPSVVPRYTGIPLRTPCESILLE